MVSDLVQWHFQHPQHVGEFARIDASLGCALIASPASGQFLQLQIRVNAQKMIDKALFKAQGNHYTIACGSWLTGQLPGMSLAQAQQITRREIMQVLKIPTAQAFCAIIAEDAIKTALADYSARQ